MRTATLFLFGAVLAFAAPAAAQCTGAEGVDFTRVTLDEVNAISQDNIAALNAAGADLTIDDITANIQGEYVGETVEFTAVIMTNPLLSGLGSPSTTGAPNRYHVFVRDTAAETEGPEGMGAQLVDGNGISSGSITDFFVGDEVTVCGDVSFFGTAIQIDPVSITNNANPRVPGDPILDPVVITTGDIHDTYSVDGTDRSQIDWDIYSDYVNQYVRFETIELVQGVPATRPNMLFSTTGDDATIRSDDISVCFRNDRAASSYYPGGDVPSCVADGEFAPPATGIVNVQGFLALRSTFDAFNSTVPQGGAFAISPFEADDFDIAAAPPIISVERALLTTDGTVRATVLPGTEGNTVSSVTLSYTTPGGSGEVDLTNVDGDTYEGTIPGLVAGDFVTFSLTAVDNQNLSTPPTAAITSLVIDGPISEIFQVQVTPDGGAGSSTLITEEPVEFDLDAVVQTAYQAGSRYQATIQDDPALGPFSGVLMDFGSEDPGLSVGDQINISSARVSEFNSVTQLVDVTFTTTGSGDPYPAKEVTTDLFNGTDGEATGEQHEGMLLRFEDAVVTSTNPDEGSGDFGEWAFSSDGTAENELRADDASNAFAADFNSTLAVGQMITIEGYLSYSFGNYKLIPTEASDVELGPISREGDLETSSVRIAGTYPNPAAGQARVAFELAVAGNVSLRLFDTMGREVAVMTEGARTAGPHTVTADLGGLASGVYVLRLDAAGEVATARIAVVR